MDTPRKYTNEQTAKFLARMDSGKEYEKVVKNFLIENEVPFRAQLKYKTTYGNYMADFVLEDGTIVETTEGDLEKCEKHPFIARKLLKLKELINAGFKIVIVTPNVESWSKRVNCRVITDAQFLNENKK